MNNNESQEEKRVSTRIDENLPADLYTKASVALMNALTLGEFNEFESLLDDDVRTFLTSKKEVKNGKAETMEYWKDWRNRFVDRPFGAPPLANDFEVSRSNYYSHACLLIRNTLILFRFNSDLITSIILTIAKSSEYSEDDKMNYPLDIKRIKQYLEPLPEKDDDGNPIHTVNRMPCLRCGTESANLNWYKSTIPSDDFFKKRYNIGQVSVCPQCGRIVEYEQHKFIDAGTDEFDYTGPEYSDNGNDYSFMADKIYSVEMLESLNDGKTDTFVSYLLSQLIDIRLAPNLLISLNLPEQTGHGDNSRLIVMDENNNVEELDISKHLRVKQTEMVAWQLYLLSNFYTVLPQYWHALYNRCEYIFKPSDIDGILPLKFHDLSELEAQNLFVPLVEVKEKNKQGCIMVVRCCYWNYWQGLVKEESTIRIEGDRCVSIESERTNLFKYRCGIWF